MQAKSFAIEVNVEGGGKDASCVKEKNIQVKEKFGFLGFLKHFNE